MTDGRWVDCSVCEGGGGYVEDGRWVQCSGCDGEEGWTEPVEAQT